MSYLVFFVSTEQSGVVPFLDNDEGDARAVINLKFHACLTHRTQLMAQNLWECRVTRYKVKYYRPETSKPVTQSINVTAPGFLS